MWKWRIRNRKGALTLCLSPLAGAASGLLLGWGDWVTLEGLSSSLTKKGLKTGTRFENDGSHSLTPTLGDGDFSIYLRRAHL